MRFRDILMAAATQGGGGAAPDPYGPELWPQPTFSSATGLTLAASSITGGEWVTDGSTDPARCTANVNPTTANGEQYHYEIDVTANPSGDVLQLLLGGTTTSLGSTTGLKTGTITATGVTTFFRLQSENFDIDNVTSCSVKKIL